MADVKESINQDRVKFMTNENMTAQGCVLVPKPGWPPTYIRVCAKTVDGLVADIVNKLTIEKKFTLNHKVDPAVWKNMLFQGADASARAQFVNDNSSYVYFDWINKDTKMKNVQGQEMSLLEAMRIAYGDVAESEIISVDTTRYLTHQGNELKAFVWKRKLPLAVALIVLMIMSILLLSDDPRSFLPQETYKWFATNSTLKKVVDAGQHWDKYYGTTWDRSHGTNRPGLTQDLPPQGMYQQGDPMRPFDSMRPLEPPRFPPSIPTGIPAGVTDRMKWFNSGLPPVRDNDSLLGK